MKVLVAGGAGYVGSRLVPELLKRGYQVDVVDLLWFGNHLGSDVKVVKKDILQLTIDDLRQYEQIVCLTGLSNDPMADFSPALNFTSNTAAPLYLAYTARKAGVKRFVYACSCSVYGNRVDELTDENSTLSAEYPYGISKAHGEHALLSLVTENFSVISLRKGTISGYSPRMRFDLIVNTMFKTAMREGVITVNNPSIWRPILSVDDAVTAYIRAIEANYNLSGAFNVASGNYTVGEVADSVRNHVGTHVRVDVKHIHDIRNYKVSGRKASEVLSYNPRHTVVDILKELTSHLEEIKDWDNCNYYNIQVFRSLL
jgi:nucleoside-diphosphate-sugar epimerase